LDEQELTVQNASEELSGFDVVEAEKQLIGWKQVIDVSIRMKRIDQQLVGLRDVSEIVLPDEEQLNNIRESVEGISLLVDFGDRKVALDHELIGLQELDVVVLPSGEEVQAIENAIKEYSYVFGMRAQYSLINEKLQAFTTKLETTTQMCADQEHALMVFEKLLGVCPLCKKPFDKEHVDEVPVSN
jgi:hypothetical protein